MVLVPTGRARGPASGSEAALGAGAAPGAGAAVGAETVAGAGAAVGTEPAEAGVVAGGGFVVVE